MAHDSSGTTFTTWRAPALLTMLLLAASLALASCGATTRTTTGRARPTAFPTLAPPTATPYAALPLFSDWRIAYLSDADVLHAYALDGASDVAGPTLRYAIDTPTLSPDGRTLAYITSETDSLVVMRLAR
ncbi:MAG TPA: hypothetical protein VGR57_03220, partial [Ktedonobacterales bacterium]|nr:hypothetical protein [Ktedonobacterales bacterium]